MTQIVHDELAVAIAEARAVGSAVVYEDSEIGGFGVYAKAELGSAGSWVRRDMVVHDTDLTDAENERMRGA